MHRAVLLALGLTLLAAPPLAAAAPSYAERAAGVERSRRALSRSLSSAATDRDRATVLRAAGRLLTRAVVERLAPAWIGTPWAFHGTTETPREGHIACGYFVTTLLRDAGLHVERARLARQAAEHIIASLTDGPHVRRFSDVALGRFVDAVAAMGDGLFVVGLDSHVGLLAVAGAEVRFIHSSNVGCACVVAEDARRSEVLAASRYRVVGRISADARLLARWLRGDPIATRGPHP